MNIGGLDGLRSQTVLGTNLSIKGHMHALSKPLEQRIKDGHTWGHLKLVVNPNPTKRNSYCTLKLPRRKSALWQRHIQSILASGQ